MGLRFLFSVLFNLRRNVNVLRRTQYAYQLHHCLSGRYEFVHRKQFLHVKVYDKDARFEAQRLARNTDNEDIEDPDYKERKFTNQESVRKLLEPKKDVKNFDSVKESDPDVFGNVSSSANEDNETDEGDLAEEEYLSRPTKPVKTRTVVYARLIKEHLIAKRVKEAIEVLEVRMLKEDRAKPEKYIYNLLINGCAKAGYTKKAFNLFTRMRQRGFPASAATYTSLFNACANAPSASEGLKRAQQLREIMLEKGHEPNPANFNVMIKAFGRCGDVKTAYLLADEMMDRQLEVDTRTFNFLLQACASDAEHGFRHCLLTWHKMLQRGHKPDYYTFNTVLRCVRDCGLGDLQTMEKVLKQIMSESKPRHIGSPPSIEMRTDTKTQGNGQHIIDNSTEDKSTSVIKVEQEESQNKLQFTTDSKNLEIPNLLLPEPHLGSLISISEITKPHERFLLLGGLTGFLGLMKQYGVTPSIETFTTMLEVIPPTNTAEKQLISFIRKIGLKSDIDFFNILIKKRSMRFDYESAKEVHSMIRTAGLRPDIVTYGVLSLGCQTRDESRELLQQMHANGIRMNVQILGAMLKCGCAQRSFPYIIEILQISLDENIRPNEAFLRHLHNFYNQCARAIDSRHPSTKSLSFKNGHAKFCAKLRLWYEEQGIANLKLEDAINKLKESPYKYLKEESTDGMEPDKSEKLSKKQKLRKYIKKIKIENLRDDDEATVQGKRLE